MLRYFVIPLVCPITCAVAVSVADVAVLRLLRYFSSFPTCIVYTRTHTQAVVYRHNND